jgi:hypothetical protein
MALNVENCIIEHYEGDIEHREGDMHREDTTDHRQRHRASPMSSSITKGGIGYHTKMALSIAHREGGMEHAKATWSIRASQRRHRALSIAKVASNIAKMSLSFANGIKLRERHRIASSFADGIEHHTKAASDTHKGGIELCE